MNASLAAAALPIAAELPGAAEPDARPGKPMADAVRMLAVDAVELAKSGHPGAPMGMAHIAVALWARHLRHDPADAIAALAPQLPELLGGSADLTGSNLTDFPDCGAVRGQAVGTSTTAYASSAWPQ